MCGKEEKKYQQAKGKSINGITYTACTQWALTQVVGLISFQIQRIAELKIQPESPAVLPPVR